MNLFDYNIKMSTQDIQLIDNIINDAKKSSIFDEYAVVVEHQLRGWM